MFQLLLVLKMLYQKNVLSPSKILIFDHCFNLFMVLFLLKQDKKAILKIRGLNLLHKALMSYH